MFFPFHDDNPTVRTPVVTLAIIAANVAALIWLSQLPELKQQVVAYEYGFVPARIAQLADPGPLVVALPSAERPGWGPWQAEQLHLKLDPRPQEIYCSLLTCMFLHGGWMHLIGNMWFLWIFGNNVEDRLGPVLYSILYLVGGLLATGSHWLTDPLSQTPVIGASGAVAAILGAYAVTWPWARVRTLVFLLIFITIIDVPALLVLGVWFLGQLAAGTEALGRGGVAEGVAWWAHIGGFAAGVVLMPLFSLVVAPPPARQILRLGRAR